ncbi:MAG: Hsp70 family protein [Planctomycetes bacterium]|nr:Hsp70 family protein [Planctomycetota bacterium]
MARSRGKREPSRYVVGIDLGTTNSALAYVDAQAGGAGAARIRPFAIPQTVAPKRVSPERILPSSIYLAGPHDLEPGSLDLPWAKGRDFAVGRFAQLQGARIPARLVTSAKSWLCHGGVERTADILPWNAPEEVAKISPVEASARVLRHIREAWDQAHPGAPLAAQDVILGVPASFDEVARELTVDAAKKAGLAHVRLLEEPQAAFYAWLARHEEDWREILHPGELVLVIDVGGGTTDLNLIRVSAGPTLERVAVGEHLLLGGDNMDLALARAVEERATGERVKLATVQWRGLCERVRAAKEVLLARLDEGAADETVAITIEGAGTRVVGGAVRFELAAREVASIILEGFFPLVGPDEPPARASRGGLGEWGLPYAADPAATRHLGEFLRRHAHAGEAFARPDVVLFNGGVLLASAIRERVLDALGGWFGRPRMLEADNLDLAVAHGAAYYGLVLRGEGVRIRGGAARAYYVGVEGGVEGGGEGGEPLALCVAPRGMEEGQEHAVEGRSLTVLANRPVRFPFYGSSVRAGDRPGDLVRVERGSVFALPPIQTVLRFGRRRREEAEVPVRLRAHLTEVGTLELWCDAERTEHRWRLQFDLRAAAPDEAEIRAERARAADLGYATSPAPSAEMEVPPEAAERPEAGSEAAMAGEGGPQEIVDEPTLEGAAALIRAAFGFGEGRRTEPRALVKEIERTLDRPRDDWPTPTIRRIWTVLSECGEGRGRSSAAESRWLNLSGFALRPGFGDPVDPWRIREMWRVFHEGLRFPSEPECRNEWWILWRRISGGLAAEHQQEVYSHIAGTLFGGTKLKKAKRAVPAAAGRGHETGEMWRTIASLERLPWKTKVEIGEILLGIIEAGEANDALFWALGRLAARIPLYGPLNELVPGQTASAWLGRILAMRWPKDTDPSFALVWMARATADRDRDLDEGIVGKLRARLRAHRSFARLDRLLTEPVALERREEKRAYGDALPPGLRLAGDP